MIDGFFDIQFRLEELDQCGDPLTKLNELVDWELFRNDLIEARRYARGREKKTTAGRKPHDPIMMFKILIIQSLYNLADDAMEYQIKDRISFMRFLGLRLSSVVPDAKTIWLFREQLKDANIVEGLFERFDHFLRESGFEARKGTIIDASIVNAPIQRNKREENQSIKKGDIPEEWRENKRRQKDTDARWTQKNKKSYYGYKNHIAISNGDKLIRAYEVTDASVHDSQVTYELLDPCNTSRDVWADSAYRSEESVENLSILGYREHLQRKGYRGRKLTKREIKGNHTRSKTRSRVEHIFGVQSQIAGTLIIRTIGVARAKVKIGLRNLAYNMKRLGVLVSN